MTIVRGNYHQPAPGYSFRVNRPVTVYLAVAFAFRALEGQSGAAWDAAMRYWETLRSDDASRCEVAVYPRTARALGCEGIRFAGAGRVPEEEAQRIAAVARLFCRAAGCEGSPR